MSPSFEDVLVARSRITGRVHRTPVLESSYVNNLLGLKAYFKAENFQKCGSFKTRGAMNAVLAAGDRAKAGVVTHSSGNHGQSLAFAATSNGIPCAVVCPRNAPQCKQDAMTGYGARIIPCGPTGAEREAALAEEAQRTGAYVIPPYNHPDVIAGQGTLMLELLEDTMVVEAGQPSFLDVVLVPVGGGGLISGCALAARGLAGPNTRVIGVEPELACDAAQSLASGKVEPQLAPVTIADGLRASLGELTFAVIKEHVSEIVLVSEEEIAAALRLIMERLKVVAEPSGAVAFAGAIKLKKRLEGLRVGIIICGGNLDLLRNACLPFWEAQG